MTLSGKLEFVQEIKSPGNVFFEIYGSNKEYLPKICPDKIPVIELLEGNWGAVGCTLVDRQIIPDKILVHYLLERKEAISKGTVEAVDKENLSMSYNIFEGDLMKLYKTMKYR